MNQTYLLKKHRFAPVTLTFELKTTSTYQFLRKVEVPSYGPSNCGLIDHVF